MARSFLFVPADSEKKLINASASKADALILDLEDSIVAAERPNARNKPANLLLALRLLMYGYASTQSIPGLG